METERKFLVKCPPANLKEYPSHTVAQGYISTHPVIRIRKWDDKRILTVKSAGLIQRQEFEMPLSEEEFQNLSRKVEGRLIQKTRTLIPIPGTKLTIELDQFHDVFEGLMYAEVEFPDLSAAEAFLPPDWFFRDVTGDPRYQNSSLSQLTPEGVRSFMQQALNP